MAQPLANGCEIDARLEQMNRRSMPEGVQVNPFSGDRGALVRPLKANILVAGI